jgi:hypothetical protein
MLFANVLLYHQVRRAKLGEVILPEPLESLRQWICGRYSVNVLYIVYDTIEIGPHEGQPRLSLILDTDKDCTVLHQDRSTVWPHIKAEICEQLAERVSATGTQRQYAAHDVHLVCDDFSEEAKGKAIEAFVASCRQQIRDEFRRCQVWDVVGFSQEVVVFYRTEEMKNRNRQNGCDDAIKRRCFELVTQYDEFRYFTFDDFRLTFDSRENFNRRYSGNLFNYFR